MNSFTSSCAVDDSFSDLNPENLQKNTRKIEVNNKALEAMIGGLGTMVGKDFQDKEFKEFLRSLPRDIPFSAADVYDFSLWIGNEINYSPTFLGRYLTALALACPENEVTIATHHLEVVPSSLGYRWKDKHLTIEGNGSFVGRGMRSGTIVVKGDAGEYSGDKMRGGSLFVEGNSKKIGSHMQGGFIEVYGDETENLGYHMKEGRIYVHGDVIGLGSMRGGRIMIDGDIRSEITSDLGRAHICVDGKRPKISQEASGGVIQHHDKIIYMGRKKLKR